MALRSHVRIELVVHDHILVADLEPEAAVGGAERDREAAVAADGAPWGGQRLSLEASRDLDVGTEGVLLAASLEVREDPVGPAVRKLHALRPGAVVA